MSVLSSEWTHILWTWHKLLVNIFLILNFVCYTSCIFRGLKCFLSVLCSFLLKLKYYVSYKPKKYVKPTRALNKLSSICVCVHQNFRWILLSPWKFRRNVIIKVHVITPWKTVCLMVIVTDTSILTYDVHCLL